MSMAAQRAPRAPHPEDETFAVRWKDRDHILIPKNGHHAIQNTFVWRGRGCAHRIKVEEARDPIVMWRSPVDRLLSCWMHFKHTNTKYASAYPGFPKDASWRSWDTWVVAVCSIPDDQANKHIRSQMALCHWKEVPEGAVLVPWDFERYAQLMGVERIEPANVTKAAKPFVSMVTMGQILRRYAKDAEVWNGLISKRS